MVDGEAGLLGAAVVDDFDIPDGAHEGALDIDELALDGRDMGGGETEGDEPANERDGAQGTGQQACHVLEGGAHGAPRRGQRLIRR